MLIKDYGCLISYRKCLVSKRWITRNRKWNYNYEPSRDGFREMRNEILSMIRKDKEDYEDNSFKLTLIFYLFPNILCYLLVHPKMQIKEQEFTMIWLSFPKDNGISIRKLLYHESVIEKPLEMNLGLEAEL